MTEVMLERSHKAQLKALLEAEIEGEASIVLPQLADRIAEMVLSDEELMSGLLAEIIRPYVYEQGKRIFAQTRNERVVELGDEVVARSKFEARARVVSSRFERWMEHADGRYVNFMEMRKADLEEAARQRKARASTEMAVVEFELQLARKLKKGEKVGDRFTPEQLDAMWEDTNPNPNGEVT